MSLDHEVGILRNGVGRLLKAFMLCEGFRWRSVECSYSRNFSLRATQEHLAAAGAHQIYLLGKPL